MSLKKLSVSIVIPNYNGQKLLAQNLPEVISASQGAEIIIVDDASTDNSVTFVKQNYPGVKIAQHQTNQRFAVACNTGVKKASGDIIVLINNDVIPTNKFLKNLIQPFSDTSVFAVGCSEKKNSKHDQVSGRSCAIYKKGFIQHFRCPDQTQQNTLWVSGGSGAFRRSMWLKLGGMDELFNPAYEEDRDICYRALKRGWLVLYEPKSYVYHDHEQTNRSVFSQFTIQTASYKNHLLFCWKNLTQPKYITQHLFWLPYHLIFTSIRSKGQFLLAFIWAISYLPQIISKRQIEAREGAITDEEILSQYKS